MSGFVRTPRTIPIINKSTDLVAYLAKWRSTLNQTLRAAVPPAPPFNFTATNARGGINLSWASVGSTQAKGVLGQAGGPDGYEILRSVSGDFVSDLTVIPLASPSQTSYFDSVGGPPKTVSYRIRTTAGSANQPHSVKGPQSGTVTATSIDSNDTVTTPTSVRDQYTSDSVRATARRGNYRERY